MAVHDLARAWRLFFHAPEPPDSAALFRILLGALVLSDALLQLRGPGLLLLGPDGVYGGEAYRNALGFRRFSVFAWLPPTRASVVWVLRALAASAFCLSVGFCTRFSAAVVWLLLTSIHHRNLAACDYGDPLVALMVLLLAFSPAGKTHSVDAWLAGRSADAVDPWCVRLMQLQVSLVYLHAVGWKLRGWSWLEGSAVYDVLRMTEFRRVVVPDRWARLLSLPATWGTLVIEAALASAIWSPALRPWVVAAGMLLHLGLEVFVNLQLFGWLMIACLTLFLDPLLVRRWLPF